MSLLTAVFYVNPLLESIFIENSPFIKFLLQTIVTWLALVIAKVENGCAVNAALTAKAEKAKIAIQLLWKSNKKLKNALTTLGKIIKESRGDIVDKASSQTIFVQS